MSACEMPDFLWECVSCSGTRDRKTKLSFQNGSTAEVDRKKRKKKCFKCKDGTTRDPSKKKEKKKKKKKKKIKALTQASGPGGPVLTMEPSGLDSTNNLLPDPAAPAGNSKLKKKVAFDLSPCAVRIKRPKPSSSTVAFPMKSILLKVEGDEDDNDSQDVDSQDLFITQKTFRAPSPEASSGEVTPKASIAVPPLALSPRGGPELRHLYRWASRPKREEATFCKEKNGETLTQTTRLGFSLLKEESSSPVDKLANWGRLEVEPNVIPPSQEVIKSKKHFKVVSRESVSSTSTQTENFFTTELSSYRRFCQSHTPRAESARPLDLSLPYRVRAASCTSTDTQQKRDEAGLQSDSDPKSAETVTSGDDNDPHARAGAKLELAQVKAVQTRLNESFFFKTKGSGRSPRPESPLMKLHLGGAVTTRRCR